LSPVHVFVISNISKLSTFFVSRELGKKLREEQDKQRLLQQEGYEKQKQFAEEGKRMYEEKLVIKIQIHRES
jgi:hypothetical protein